MISFNDLMIDTETMGGPPNGALLSIGAVFFDLHTLTMGPEFHRTIHLSTSVRDGGEMHPSTVLWWLGQSDEARNAVRWQGQDIKVVLKDFSDWIAETCPHRDVRPWGNSPHFDMSVVGGAYKRAGLTVPWHWVNERDFRTVHHMYPAIEYNTDDKGGGAHNALEDAKFQVNHLFKIKNRNRAPVEVA